MTVQELIKELSQYHPLSTVNFTCGLSTENGGYEECTDPSVEIELNEGKLYFNVTGEVTDWD